MRKRCNSERDHAFCILSIKYSVTLSIYDVPISIKFIPLLPALKNHFGTKDFGRHKQIIKMFFITVRIRFNFFTIPENKKYTHSCAALAGTLFFIDCIQCLQWSHSESHCSTCTTSTLPTPRMSHGFSEPGMLAPSRALTELIAETEIQNLAG